MKQKRKRGPKVSWTFEKCKEEALKYTKRNEFRLANQSCYQSARKNNWLNTICKHMLQIVKPKNYWTLQRVHKEAKNYSTRLDFKKGSSTYNKARSKGWLDIVCSHMETNITKYWIKDRCREEALKYKHRNDFFKNCRGGYKSARLNGWMDEICSHMELQGNLARRYVYIHISKCKKVYIGLTCNKVKRESRHRKNERIFMLNNECSWYSELMSVDQAIKTEKRLIREARVLSTILNYEILNKDSGGGIGGVNVLKLRK